MVIDLRGYRIFLSSPSGLEAERAAFFRTVSEVNEIEAEDRGRTFIPHGWEQETRGWGRPQGRLNVPLKECDYLILILADRWGSPTGPNGTGFSSGTEEEYNVARECLLGDEPMRDIVVLFKGIPERQLVDPGEQLRKVLAFKAALEKEKSLLFATFDAQADLERIIRLHLHRWLRDDDDDLPAQPRPSKGNLPPASPQEEATGEMRLPAAKDQGGDSPLETAQELARSGKTAKAEGRFAKAVSEDSDDLEAHLKYAQFLRRSDRLAHAVEVSRQLISLAKAREEDEWTIRGLANLGICLRKQGQLEQATASLAEAIGLAGEDARFRRPLAYAENNLGLTLRRSGDIGQAESHYLRALNIYEELGDDDGLAHAHINLSYVIREQGDLPQARNHADAVIALGESSQQCLAMAHCNLGLIAEEEGDLAAAKQCFGHALKLNVELENAAGEAMSYAHLARVKLESGDEQGALVDGGRALALNERSGNADGIAMSLRVIGLIEMQRQEWGLAESRLSDARDIYMAIGFRIGISGTSADLAVLFARTRRLRDADEALDQARASGKGIDHVSLQNGLKRAEKEVAAAREVDSSTSRSVR